MGHNPSEVRLVAQWLAGISYTWTCMFYTWLRGWTFEEVLAGACMRWALMRYFKRCNSALHLRASLQDARSSLRRLSQTL